jgi:two-component system sensor kinase FixL
VTVRDNNVATHLFRIAQEAVNNAVNHARPSRITVSLSLEDDALMLSVTDDGDGLRGHAIDNLPGMGIRIMTYRANVIGAILNIQPNERGGTTVRCAVERST